MNRRESLECDRWKCGNWEQPEESEPEPEPEREEGCGKVRYSILQKTLTAGGTNGYVGEGTQSKEEEGRGCQEEEARGGREEG